jgi:uncharacterized protein (DUF305 family)
MFDVEISKMFIEHHRMQIRESEKCLERAFHEKLRSFCKHTIEEQSQEIKQFRTVLAEHGRKNQGPKGHDQEA